MKVFLQCPKNEYVQELILGTTVMYFILKILFSQANISVYRKARTNAMTEWILVSETVLTVLT